MTRYCTCCVAALVIAATVTASAQQRQPAVSASSGFKAPRTPWGEPDQQGTWPSGPLMTIPFERPPDMGTRATLTDDEAEARSAAIAAAVSTPAPPAAFLQPFWNEYGRAPALTSLIADPANGRLPEMTADGAERGAAPDRAVSISGRGYAAVPKFASKIRRRGCARGQSPFLSAATRAT